MRGQNPHTRNCEWLVSLRKKKRQQQQPTRLRAHRLHTTNHHRGEAVHFFSLAFCEERLLFICAAECTHIYSAITYARTVCSTHTWRAAKRWWSSTLLRRGGGAHRSFRSALDVCVCVVWVNAKTLAWPGWYMNESTWPSGGQAAALFWKTFKSLSHWFWTRMVYGQHIYYIQQHRSRYLYVTALIEPPHIQL